MTSREKGYCVVPSNITDGRCRNCEEWNTAFCPGLSSWLDGLHTNPPRMLKAEVRRICRNEAILGRYLLNRNLELVGIRSRLSMLGHGAPNSARYTCAEAVRVRVTIIIAIRKISMSKSTAFLGTTVSHPNTITKSAHGFSKSCTLLSL
ncbi:hypothetical protein F4679DRAFT_356460 [Xylaria curta]|nr:hypothetical protein F4679DRAFT_356460 [Xylaria curta]